MAEVILDFRQEARMPKLEVINSKGKNIRFPNYFQEPRKVVDQLHGQLLYRRGFFKDSHPDTYELFIGWFPTAKKQARLETGNPLDFSKYVARGLGNFAFFDYMAHISHNEECRVGELLGVNNNQLDVILSKSHLLSLLFSRYFRHISNEFVQAGSYVVGQQITTLAEFQGYRAIYNTDPKLSIENLLS